DNLDTIRDFAAIVQTQERLDYLTLLTWADVTAVSGSAWTLAQDAFLRALYEGTSSLLGAAVSETPDAPAVRQRLARQLRGGDVDEAEVQAFVESLPAYYLTSAPPSLVRLHFKLAEKAREGEPSVEAQALPELGATDF